MGNVIHALVVAVAALCVAGFLLGGEPAVGAVVVMVVAVGTWRVTLASRPRTRPRLRSPDWRGNRGRGSGGSRGNGGNGGDEVEQGAGADHGVDPARDGRRDPGTSDPGPADPRASDPRASGVLIGHQRNTDEVHDEGGQGEGVEHLVETEPPR